MMLSGKRATVFAADEKLGEVVARHLARQGAEVWVSGLDTEAVEALAEKIRADGGEAHSATVDPTDPYHVREYVNAVVSKGPLDASFNGFEVPANSAGMGVPYRELDPAVFTDVYDWHVRYQQPIEVSRVDNRTAIRFMFTWLILRPEQADGYVGIPYDRA